MLQLHTIRKLLLLSTLSLCFAPADGGAEEEEEDETETAPRESVRLIVDRRVPQARFAVLDLAKAATEAGYELVVYVPGRVPPAKPGEKTISLEIDRAHEYVDSGYLLTSDGMELRAICNDANECMYAAFDLAYALKDGTDIFAAGEKRHTPTIERRGLKFNIPLDARTPSFDDTGDAAQRNIGEVWSLEFWEEFLDQMARDRYNTLTLWNPHPFPSMIESESYPDVALKDVCATRIVPNGRENEWAEPQLVSKNVVDDLRILKSMTIDEKITFWRQVMRHAKSRGIDVYFITWNICLNAVAQPAPAYYRTYANSIPDEQPGKYGVTHDVNNPATIAYLRDAVKTFILTYPDLKGIGVTAGEHFPEGDHFDREKWLWETYGLGVLDAKEADPDREVSFIHRFWNTDFENIMRYWEKYPDPFSFSFKYARARLYSSPDIPFADDHVEKLKARDLKSWWNLRNDDIYVHRWGDPDYVRDFIQNFDLEATAGYHMGSDGYVWGREFVHRKSRMPRELEIKKHWYSFMLWGQLGYNVDLGRDFFVSRIGERFPEADPSAVYDTWQAASRIIPLVNRFFWRDWDHMWSPENSQGHWDGYLGVEAFANNETMEGSGLLTVREYVKGVLSERQLDGKTPIDVAAELDDYAKVSLAGADAIDSPDYHLERTLDDIRGMALLGHHYAAKIRAAVALAMYRKTGDTTDHEEAARQAMAAYEWCTAYTDHSKARYNSQMLARTGLFDWSAMLQDARKDVTYVRSLKSADK